MRLTDRQLNRATLARQLLLARERVAPVDAVYRRYQHWWSRLPKAQVRVITA